MTSMIWLEHFGKLLTVCRSVYRVESLIFHTAEENGRDSLIASSVPLLLPLVVATNQNWRLQGDKLHNRVFP